MKNPSTRVLPFLPPDSISFKSGEFCPGPRCHSHEQCPICRRVHAQGEATSVKLATIVADQDYRVSILRYLRQRPAPVSHVRPIDRAVLEHLCDISLVYQLGEHYFIADQGRDFLDNMRFPIQSHHTKTNQGMAHLAGSSIPWWLAEIAYEHYAARFGTQQSLERLAERGGFGRDELVGLLRREL